jgi:arylsulfatase A-like enzyme
MRDRCEVLGLAVGLTLLLIGTKLILLPFPVRTLGEFCRWMLRLTIVSSPDVCFAIGLAAACLAIVWWCGGHSRRRWLGRSVWFILYYVAALYAVASVPIYRWTMVPLKLPSLWLLGGGEASSSVLACVGSATWLALALAPLAVLGCGRLAASFSWLDDGAPRSPRWAILTLALVAVYGLVCRAYVQSHWADPNRWERRIAQSPHFVFMVSCVAEAICTETLDIFEDPDESDFLRPKPGTVRSLASPSNHAPRPKNLILVVLESIGAEYLGLYGARHDNTPQIERLAEQGVVFDNIYVQSPSSCHSLAALVASVYPRPDWRLLVRDEPDFGVPTIGEVLAEAGYRTCFAHSGYWRWMQRDRFLRRRGAQHLIDAESFPGHKVNSWGVADRVMFQATLDWIDAEPERPFFLFAYTIETHHPYVACRPLRDFGVADEDLNRYLNALHAADETVAWLMGELRRRRLEDSTLVAITSDNGESFGQHNQRIHSFSIYEPAVHVPLILLHPSLRHQPRRMARIGQHIDIVPTLLGALGVEAPSDWQGKDLLAAADNQADERAYFFCTGNEIILGLRDGRFKYHYHLQSATEELFDVAADPRELHNLAAGHGERCADYKRKLGGFVQYQRRFLANRRAP